jgi:hypothetical protein
MKIRFSLNQSSMQVDQHKLNLGESTTVQSFACSLSPQLHYHFEQHF